MLGFNLSLLQTRSFWNPQINQMAFLTQTEDNPTKDTVVQSNDYLLVQI
jgi:hypothetical protein